MEPGTVIGGRWRIEAPVGIPGRAVVFRAHELGNGREVALKLLPGGSETSAVRLRREIAALRLLHTPGVLDLLDVGEWQGETFLVTEFVHGAPFPGPVAPGDWRGVVAVAARLCTVLASVHAASVIHRDLKPENVLVDATGAVVLLDFGLARGAALERTVTADGVVGSPRYLAPEQLFGARIDARADLYAVGVMLWEALAGRALLDGHAALLRVTTRTTPTPLSLAQAAPTAPPALVHLVHGLLQAEPGQRPASAAAVLRVLEGLQSGEGPKPPLELPLLGRAELLARVVQELRAGRPVDVWADRGVGKSRFLDEVAAQLVASGQPVFRPPGGERGLESLVPLVGQPSSALGALADVAERVARRLRDGLVIVLDESPAADAVSRRILDRSRAHGAILRVHDSPGAVRLEPLTEHALRAAFVGADRVVHLREDAAAELHRRTSGVPVRVVAELDAWVAARLATWDGERVSLDRAALDRLEAGLNLDPPARPVHDGPLAPHQTELLGWVNLVLGPVEPAALADAAGLDLWEVDLQLEELEAMGAVHRRWDGRVEARYTLPWNQALPETETLARHRALASALPSGDPARLRHLLVVDDREGAVVETLFQAQRLSARGMRTRAFALAWGSWQLLQRDLPLPAATRLLAELARLSLPSGNPQHRRWAARALRELGVEPALAELVEAWSMAEGGQERAASRRAAALAPFADPELERRRRLLREVEADGPPASAAELRGAAERAATEPERLDLLIRAGLAQVDGPDPEGVRGDAEELLRAGVARRSPRLELWGLHLARVADYRAGVALQEDPELITLSAEFGPARRHARALVTEAAVLWRLGRVIPARGRAREAARQLADDADPDALLARAFWHALGGDDRESLARTRDAVIAGPEGPALGEAATLLEWAAGPDERLSARRRALREAVAGWRCRRLRVLDRDELGDP